MNKINLYEKIRRVSNQFLRQENSEIHLTIEKIKRKEYIYYNVARTIVLYGVKPNLDAKARAMTFNFIHTLWTRDDSKLYWVFSNQFRRINLITKFAIYGIVQFLKNMVYVQDPFQHQHKVGPLEFTVNWQDEFIEPNNDINAQDESEELEA